ncbi:MAG: hypothetical protein AAFW75_17985 [Cyanobacteria bacterium J06636_16]
MKLANAKVLQPNLLSLSPDLSAQQSKPVPKPQPASQVKKKKSHHRTEAGDRCDGAMRIPGLSHSLCDRCGEWIETGRFG